MIVRACINRVWNETIHSDSIGNIYHSKPQISSVIQNKPIEKWVLKWVSESLHNNGQDGAGNR